MADPLTITVEVKDPEIVECGEFSFGAFTLLMDGKEIDTYIVPLNGDE